MNKHKFISGAKRDPLIWPRSRGERWIQKADESHKVVIDAIDDVRSVYQVRSNKFGNSIINQGDFILHYKPAPLVQVGDKFRKKIKYILEKETPQNVEVIGNDGMTWTLKEEGDKFTYHLAEELLLQYYEKI
jgi:hypothetical protein